ncbi:hypothetical protein ABID26_007464 [Mesorhizobium shonense]|uniref:Uncharacterized protein n=1 Tax=Mesorhizobium shonense TaxID=1209948 RepID=A0ABV2I537_9HYPH
MATTSTIATRFNNTGTVDVESGTLTFNGVFQNFGTILADGGDIVVNSAVNDSGSAIILSASKLEYAAASNENVTFAVGSTGTLRLDDSQDYTGTVSNLAAGNFLDLSDIMFGNTTSLGYAANQTDTGGTLTITDGNHTAQVALLGQYLASSFTQVSDGHGGTLISIPPTDTATLLSQPQNA